MSKVGNVEKMFGNRFDIVTTNAPADTILNSENINNALIPTALIITSPLYNAGDLTSDDKGTPSLIITDFEGVPMRLTYTIQPGNGLKIDDVNKDVIKMAIDKKTIVCDETSKELFVDGSALLPDNSILSYVSTPSGTKIDLNVKNLPDDNRITYVLGGQLTNTSDNWRTYLTINAYNLVDNYYVECNEDIKISEKSGFQNQKITVNLHNIVDENTIIVANKKNNGKKALTVEAKNLSLASSTSAGVIKIDDSTIKRNPNNQIYVETKNLPRISYNAGPGVIYVGSLGSSDSFYGDNTGRLFPKTVNFPKADNKSNPKRQQNKYIDSGFGVVKADGTTIVSDGGVIHVNTNSLAAPSGNSKGVVTVDNKTITHNGGKLSVKTTGLDMASSVKPGIVKIDGGTIMLNSSGQIYCPSISAITTNVNNVNTNINTILNRISSLEYNLQLLNAKINSINMSSFSLTLNNEEFTSAILGVGVKHPTGIASIVNNKTFYIQSQNWSASIIGQFKFKFISQHPIRIATRYSGSGQRIELDKIAFDPANVSVEDKSGIITSGSVFHTTTNGMMDMNLYFKCPSGFHAPEEINSTIEIMFYDNTNSFLLRTIQFVFENYYLGGRNGNSLTINPVKYTKITN